MQKVLWTVVCWVHLFKFIPLTTKVKKKEKRLAVSCNLWNIFGSDVKDSSIVIISVEN
jgi:hypothetical protein